MVKLLATAALLVLVLSGASASDPIASCAVTDEIHHGGGLNACGCHFNRKTGECHCHQSRGCGCACQPAGCK